MKRLSLYLLLFLGIFNCRVKAQLTISSDQLFGGDFKDQQTVKVKPNTSTGTTIITPNGSTQYQNNLPFQDAHLFVDPTIPANTPYQTQPNSPTYLQNHQIDYSLPVGSISGSYHVNSMGGLSYNIPISLPPGTHGMIPSVSIAYNSNRSSQIAGLGWGISGMSAITRGPKDIYHDFYTEGITFDGSDALLFNGNRMIELATGFYALENEDFTRIQHFSSGTYGDYYVAESKNGTKMEFGNSPSSKIKLTKPNTNNQLVNYAYYLNKVKDTYGNYMDYDYYNSANEINLKEIKYTGTIDNQGNNIPPYNSVKFHYDNRGWPENRFLYGNLLPLTKILREIEIYVEGNPIKKYNFIYSNNGKHSLLNEIVETGMDNSKLNSTLISYGKGEAPAISHVSIPDFTYSDDSGADHPSCSDYRIGDFNGDGLSDILAFIMDACTVQVNSGARFYTGWQLFLNAGDGVNFVSSDSKTNYSIGDFNAYGSFNYGTSWSQNPIGTQNGDFNGDGMDDLLLGRAPTSTQDMYELLLSDGTNLSSHSMGKDGVDLGSVINIGDFDGDKRIEAMAFKNCSGCNHSDAMITFLAFRNNAYHSYYSLQNHNGAIIYVNTLSGGIKALEKYNGFSALDFDGDGISDISAIDDNQHQVVIKVRNLNFLSFQGSNVASFTLDEIYNSGIPATDYTHLLFGDFNGDGLTDKVSMGDNLITKCFGTGIDYTATSPVTEFPTYFGHTNMDKKHLTLDIDGDGITEVVYLDCSSGDIKIKVTFLRSGATIDYGTISGKTFPLVKDNNRQKPFYINSSWSSCNDANMNNNFCELYSVNTAGGPQDDAYPKEAFLNPEFNTGDFNGDGYTDIMLKTGTGGERTIIYFNPYDVQNFVTNILDGFNNMLEFEYQPLSTINQSGFYGKGSGAVFPVMDIRNSYYATSSVKAPDGLGGTFNIKYKYEDAKIHLQGKGFLGFGKVVSENSVTSSQEISEYKAPDALFFTRLLDKTTKNIMPGTPVSSKTYYTSLVQQMPGSQSPPKKTMAFFRTDKVISFDAIANVTDEKEFYYDGSLPGGTPNAITHGNITLIKEVNGNGMQTIETTLDYISGGTGGWLQFSPNLQSRLEKSHKKIKRVLPNQPIDYDRTTNYTYYSKGDLKEIITEQGHAKSVVTLNTYYPNNGLVEKKEISAPNSPVPLPIQTTSFEYDGKMRLPTKVTTANPPNDLVNEYTYDFRTGAPLTHKGIDGLITLYSYDGFGREFQVETPDNIITTKTINWYQASSGIDLPSDPYPIASGNPLFFSRIVRPGSTAKTVIADILGRNFKSQTEGFNNNISNFTTYNAKGQVIHQVDNYIAGSSSAERLVTDFTYNNLFQPLTATVADELGTFAHINSTTYSYDGAGNSITTVTTPDGKTFSRTTDAIGSLTSAIDFGGNLTYEYGSDGNVISVKHNGTVISRMEYDPIFSTQTKLWEANTGDTKFSYNAYGQLYEQEDFRTNKFNYEYDKLGRLKKVSGAENYDYAYVNTGFGIGQTEKIIDQGTGIEHKFKYDGFGRTTQFDETIDGALFSTQYQYDNFSNLATQIYPSGFGIKREYDSKGYPTTIKRIDNGGMIWQADEVNRFGAYTKYTLGNSVQTLKTFDVKGFPVTSQSGNIQNLSFNYDNKSGNLNSLTDFIANKTESFTIDPNLDVLTDWQVAGSPKQTIAYTPNNNGNIQSKTDIGAYTYGSKPHAVTLVENLGGIISTTQQDISYNSFNKTANIIEGSKEAHFTYGPDQEREKMEMKSGGQTSSTKYYLSEYEKETLPNNVSREVHYINAPYGLCAMYVNDNGSKDMYYVYSDHQSNINTLASASGNIIRQNFDPWGRPRNPSTWDYSNVPAVPNWLTRGYTGHEGLPDFKLINMNGRMYDPLLSRMLSPDILVANPSNTQSYNKYSYAYNNPLKYTDPSGYVGISGDLVAAPGSFDFSPSWQLSQGPMNGFIDASGNYSSDWTQIYEAHELWLEKVDRENVAKYEGGHPSDQLGYWVDKNGATLPLEMTVTGYKSDATYDHIKAVGEAQEAGFAAGFASGVKNSVSPTKIWEGLKNTFTTAEGLGNLLLNTSSLGFYGAVTDASDVVTNLYKGDYYALGQITGNTTVQVGTAVIGLKVAKASGIVKSGTTTLKTIQYTKSSLSMGRQMHKLYKAGLADNVTKFKEFRLPSGKRIDFLDISEGTIYELKPFNPRSMNQGIKQLNGYMQELQSMPRFEGTPWKTVLDTY